MLIIPRPGVPRHIAICRHHQSTSTWWPVTHGRVIVVLCKVTCSVYACTVAQVTFYKVPEKTAMFIWPVCIKKNLVLKAMVQWKWILSVLFWKTLVNNWLFYKNFIKLSDFFPSFSFSNVWKQKDCKILKRRRIIFPERGIIFEVRRFKIGILKVFIWLSV